MSVGERDEGWRGAKDRFEEGNGALRAGQLRRLVEESVSRNAAECLLLSGGLDTSVLAPLAAKGGTTSAVTVVVGTGAPDEPHAVAVAHRLGLNHHLVRTTLDGLLEEARFVVRTLRTFDPMEVRNSIVIARGLREAAQLGYVSVMTGDGADELFAGYSYMWTKPEEEFERYSERLVRIMRFSSVPLGTALGLRVRTPYTDPDVVHFALALPKGLKVGSRDGVTHGKFLLRLAFPEADACWRRKDPIEVGSGSAALSSYFRERIPSAEFEVERASVEDRDRIDIRDPEHLAYYMVFRDVFGDSPPLIRGGPDPCKKCGFELPTPESDFCTTCGAWPAR